MPKSSEVAAALRNLADYLDREPEVEIKAPQLLWDFWSERDKNQFKSLAALLPRPLTKNIDDEGSVLPLLRLIHNTPSLEVKLSIPRSATCKLIRPAQAAEYECESILSPEGEAEIGETA